MNNNSTASNTTVIMSNILLNNLFSIEIMKGYGGVLLMVFGISLANFQIVLGVIAAIIGLGVSILAYRKANSEYRTALLDEQIAQLKLEKELQNGKDNKS